MTPSDHWSVDASTSRADFICSGDMYSGEPSITEDLVRETWLSVRALALEIAMDDPAGVGLGDGIARLQDVVGDLLEGQRTPPLEDPRQVVSLEVLHHD